MNMVAIPSIPEAITYMMNPPQGKYRGVTLLRKLNGCSIEHDFCKSCGWPQYCEFYYDFLIETEAITNWKGANQNVARYFK
jgi:hypothetical protein